MNRKMLVVSTVAGLSLAGCSNAIEDPAPEVFTYSDPNSLTLPVGLKTVKCEKVSDDQLINLGATYDQETGWSCFLV